MKSKHFFYFAFIFASCGNKDESPANTETKDTTGISAVEVRYSFDKNNFKELQLPLNLDTNFIDKADSSLRLTYQQIRQTGANILKDGISEGLENDFARFAEIDSLKQDGKYEDYVKNLDIGMTKNSIAFALGSVILNGGNLFIWGMQSNSYEACPFFSAKYIIGTYVDANGKTTHILLGERSSGGDPPMMGNDDITSIINKDGSVDIKHISVSDDLDSPGRDVIVKKVLLNLKNGGIEVVKSSKEEIEKEKHTQ